MLVGVVVGPLSKVLLEDCAVRETLLSDCVEDPLPLELMLLLDEAIEETEFEAVLVVMLLLSICAVAEDVNGSCIELANDRIVELSPELGSAVGTTSEVDDRENLALAVDTPCVELTELAVADCDCVSIKVNKRETDVEVDWA